MPNRSLTTCCKIFGNSVLWKHVILHWWFFCCWQFCLGDTTQREGAVSTSNIMRAVQNQKSFWQILTKLNVGNRKQISKLLPSNIKFRQDVLHHCEMRFCESWVNSTFDIPFESSRVRESCAVLPQQNHEWTLKHWRLLGHSFPEPKTRWAYSY